MRAVPQVTTNRRPAPDPVVLVIEDEPGIAELIRRALQNGGYRVICREHGGAGLALVGTLRPDVIVLDLKLPDADGRLVLRALKSDPQTRDIPVIIASAFAAGLMPDDRRLASGVLAKPFHITELLTAVDLAAA